MTLLIIIDRFPNGWTNEQRHNGHEHTVVSIGNQSPLYSHLKTHSRVNMPTEFDEEAIILEDKPTVEQFILLGQMTLADKDDIIHGLAVGIWGDNPSKDDLAAVEKKAEIIEMTEQETRDMLRNKAAAWGEI